MSLIDDYLGNERTTGRLAVNGSAKGKIHKGRDEDWFAMTLEAGVTYYLTGDNPLGSSGFAIAIYDPRAGGLVAASGGGNDSALAIEFTPDATGTYYAVAAELAGNFALAEYTLGLATRTTPDDLAGNASTRGLLTAGATAHGVFEQRGDVDWFRFRAEQGVHYSFSATGVETAQAPASLPVSLRIVDAYGRAVDTPGSGFNPLVSGDYFVSVAGARPGAYAVSASAVRDDLPEHWSTAGRIVAGGSAAGSIDYEHDRDWFHVDFRAGEYYTITLRSDQDFVFGLNLYDQAGNRLDYVAGFQFGQRLSMTYRAATDGAGIVEVERYPTVRGVDHATPYSVTLVAAADDIGDDAAGAHALALGATAQGSLQAGIDRDAFRISLQAGVSYRFDLASAPGGDYLKLELAMAADPAVLAAAAVGSKGSLEFTPVVSGDYLVTVASAGGVPPSLPYGLTATAAQDDWTAHGAGAGQLGIGASAAGRLESATDRDWFAFQAVAGATYRIDARWDTTGSGAGAAVRILGADGSQIKALSVPVHLHAPVSFKADAGGTHFIEMASAYGDSGGYTVSIVPGVADDVGDTIAGAASLPVGGPVERRFEVALDTDVFRLDAVAGRTYELRLNVAAGYAATALTDGQGKPLTDTVRNDADHKVFFAPTTGPYYLHATGGAAGAYQIEARSYLDDHPHTAPEALARLGQGAAISGALEHGFDHDLFSITLDAHRTYTFKLASTTPGRPAPAVDQVRVGAGYASIEQSVVGGERVLKVTADRAATYVLDVRSADFLPASYTLTSLPFTGDGIGPTLVAQSRADHALGIALTDRQLSFRFSEAIVIDREAIVIRDSAGKTVQQAYGRELSPILDGDTLVLKTMNYLAPGTYTVALPANAIHDKDGNRYTGPETITFTTVMPGSAPGPGNGLYVGSGSGAVIDGGPGIDTFYVNGTSAFTALVWDGPHLMVRNLFDGSYDRLMNIERLIFPDQAYALDVDGVAGQAYRLYRAAFDRTPDLGGLGFWIGHMDNGLSLQAVAQGFVGSAEFASLYGVAPTDRAFLQAVYRNVLHRDPDGAGLAYWMDALQSGLPRHELLAHFSESAENREALIDIIGGGFPYLSTWMS